MPSSWLCSAPVGVAGVCAVQVLPSQARASACSASPVPLLPTARHAVAVGQETPFNWLGLVPGTVWTVQAVPSQRAASGAVPWELRTEPTAVHAVTDEHDTAASVPML